MRVLFVCLGNICRSPTAEGVLRHKLQVAGLAGRVEVASAGTGNWHVGAAPDKRTQRAALLRGYDLSAQRAQQVVAPDFNHYDLILAMDKVNLDNLRRMAGRDGHDRIKLFMDYAQHFDDDEVPDPYYGLGHGFDLVLDMVEDASQGLVSDIKKKLGHP